MTPKPPAFLAWMVAFAVVSGVLLLVVLLPTGEAATFLVIAAVVGMFAAAVRAGANPMPIFRRGLRWFITQRPIAADRPYAMGIAISRRQTTLEIACVIALALFITQAWLTSDDAFRLGGYESEWLTNSAYLASITLRQHGYLPLWQPYMEFGEPLIHNPFGFILNPFSSLPSLLFGGQHGIKISVSLTAVIAALGGWFLARVLGLGAAGRLLLAALMLGKGNMHAMIGNGYYQLGVAQAYFPWVIGGALATLRLPIQRWSIALTALSFTLMFFAGNLWYTLPMLITLAALTLTHIIYVKQTQQTAAEDKGINPLLRRELAIDWRALRRLMLAGVFTIGLSMVVLLPLWAERERIGGHKDDLTAGEEFAIPLRRAFGQAFDFTPQWAWNETVQFGRLPLPADQFLYSYVAPLWFVLVIFVFLPPIYSLLHRPGARQSWRVWLAALPLIVFFTAWGAGNTPFFVWLYNTIPGLGQWRFVGRAFAMSSFWMGVLVAWRYDALWRAVAQIQIDPPRIQGRIEQVTHRVPEIMRDGIWMTLGGALGGGIGYGAFFIWTQLSTQLWLWSTEGRILASVGFVAGVFTVYLVRTRGIPWLARSMRALPIVLLIVMGAAAGGDVMRRWQEFAQPGVIYNDAIHDIRCVRWLRAQYPERPLSVWRLGYEIVNEFQTQGVRLSNIASDYIPLEDPPTIGGISEFPDRLLAEFAIPGYPNERAFLIDNGYRLVVGSPRHSDGVPCLYQNPHVLPYAFLLPMRLADALLEIPTRAEVIPIESVRHYPGVVIVSVQNTLSLDLVVTVQERAYPGWSVRVDGVEAPLESYLGQLAVVLARDTQPHTIVFEYRPPLLMVGGVITLVTAGALVVWLVLWRRSQ